MTEPRGDAGARRPAAASRSPVGRIRPVAPGAAGASAGAAAGGERRRGRGWLPLLAVALLAGTVGLTLYLSSRGADAVVAELPAGARLAVLPFVDEVGEADLAWVAHGLPELMGEVLLATEGARTVTRRRLDELFAARGLADAEDAEAMARVARAAGADLVLSATVAAGERGEPPYVLRYEVAGAGSEVAAAGELGGDDPLVLGEDLAIALARRLSRGRAPAGLAVAVTASPFLARLYAMGVEELASGDPAAAIPLFELCRRYDPFFALATLRLADADEASGRIGRSRQLRQDLLRDLESRGRRELQTRTLLALGDTSLRQRKLAEAAGLFTQAHTLAVNAKDAVLRAAAIDGLARVTIAREPGSGRGEELLFELIELRRAMNDRLGQVDALLELGNLALRRGDLQAAAELYAEGRDIARAAGDPHGAHRLGERLADVAARRGDDAAAAAGWAEAREHFAAAGDAMHELVLTQKLGDAQLRLGRLEEAEESFREVLEAAAERGLAPREALAARRLAEIYLRQGYPYQAREPLRRALELDEEGGDRVGLQVLIAWLAYEQGNVRLAAETQRAAKRQAGRGDWTDEREAFLAVYERAEATGERPPLPGVGGP